MVRALASHRCGPGSIPGTDVTCGLSLLLVLVLVPRVFVRVLRFSSLHKNQHAKFQFDLGTVDVEPPCGSATAKLLLLLLLLLLLQLESVKVNYNYRMNKGGTIMGCGCTTMYYLIPKKISRPRQLFRTSLVFFISKETCSQLIRWLVGSRTNESSCYCPGQVTNGGSLFHI